MGGNISQLLPAPPDFPYFSLTFSRSNKITVIDCDQRTLQVIQEVVTTHWSMGILSQCYNGHAFEIKFHGTPFFPESSKTEALATMRLFRELLTSLYSIGWELCLSSDLCRVTYMTSWFFQRNSAFIGQQLADDGRIVCLSLGSHDRFHLVNAPSYLKAALLECIGPVLENQENFGHDYEFKIKGFSWIAGRFEEEVAARKILLNIIRKFDKHKFRVYGKANFKRIANCIFFKQDDKYVGGETRFCMMSLDLDDRIRLIDCPQEVVDKVERCINLYWLKGIQGKPIHESCLEFKLKGNPWSSGGDDAINSRHLITHILESLLSVGWAVMNTLDISRLPSDKSFFVLRNCKPASVPHMSICPSSKDLIRLINAPIDTHNAIASVIQTRWISGIQKHEVRLMKAHEWKLKGIPWSSNGSNDYAVIRHLMTLLLHETAKKGWHVICSADVSSNRVVDKSGSYTLDVHSWFLARSGHEIQDPYAVGSLPAPGYSMPPFPR